VQRPHLPDLVDVTVGSPIGGRARSLAPLLVRRLGRVDYRGAAAAMQAFTAARGADTVDEIWLCEHPPVFTLGLAGHAEHLHDAGDVPVVQANRGGQVTYHGPGQVVAYPLVDLGRLALHVKEYVYRLEQAVLRTLESLGVTGHRVSGAPGVYVRLDDAFGHAALDARPAADRHAARAAPSFDGLGKIAALGIKVSRHRAYHGVALNVAMDLAPFGRIDPCGYAGLKTVDLSTIGVDVEPAVVADLLAAKLSAALEPRRLP
jgi:lipoyl(octanoyl) transferase